MYELKNGILYKDGEADFAVGTSYFASFNKDKYPVAPGKERFIEAIKDIEEIADFGFNIVRVAAFEDIKPTENGYDINMPFIDHMVKLINQNDMASVVRLQGYTMNMRKRENAVLCNIDGIELDKSDVSVFIYDNFFNRNLVEDAKEATTVLADYFDKESVVGYQIYNEPWLSGKPFSPLAYDNCAKGAYREYLLDRGVPEDQIEEHMPPKVFSEHYADKWIKYRIFVTEAFMKYFGELNDAGKKNATRMESEVNFTACPTWHSCAHFSVDYFKAAKQLDYLGLDIYDPLKGGYFHYIKALMAMVESAAFLEDKNAHIMEFCCRTHMTSEDFERQISSAVGTGFKGINFYAWRSDISGPEGGLGGILFHDRRRTPKYDEAKKAVAVVRKLGKKIALSSKIREGVAIFESEYARHMSDLTQKSLLTSVNRTVYEDIYDEGFSPDYVDADHLLENKLGVKVLFIADYSLLSDEEKDVVTDFAKKHYVFRYELGVGYVMHDECKGEVTNEKLLKNYCWKPNTKDPIADWRFKIYEVFELLNMKPDITASAKSVDLGNLMADDGSFMLITITNIHSLKNSIDSFDINIDKSFGEFKDAVLYTKDYQKKCIIESGKDTIVKIPDIETSGYLLLTK